MHNINSHLDLVYVAQQNHDLLLAIISQIHILKSMLLDKNNIFPLVWDDVFKIVNIFHNIPHLHNSYADYRGGAWLS